MIVFGYSVWAWMVCVSLPVSLHSLSDQPRHSRLGTALMSLRCQQSEIWTSLLSISAGGGRDRWFKLNREQQRNWYRGAERQKWRRESDSLPRSHPGVCSDQLSPPVSLLSVISLTRWRGFTTQIEWRAIIPELTDNQLTASHCLSSCLSCPAPLEDIDQKALFLFIHSASLAFFSHTHAHRICTLFAGLWQALLGFHSVFSAVRASFKLQVVVWCN